MRVERRARSTRRRRGGRRDERTKHSRRRLVRAGARKRTTNAKRERVRVTRRGARSGLRGRHAQVHQPAVQRFALLNHVILLQELLQGEALLVEHELRGGGARLKRGRADCGQFRARTRSGPALRGGEGERERAPKMEARRRVPESTRKRCMDVIATAAPAKRLRAAARTRRVVARIGPRDAPRARWAQMRRSRGRDGPRRDAPRREMPAPVQATSKT